MSLGKWRLNGKSGGRAVGYARGRWGEAPCGRACAWGAEQRRQLCLRGSRRDWHAPRLLLHSLTWAGSPWGVRTRYPEGAPKGGEQVLTLVSWVTPGRSLPRLVHGGNNSISLMG